MKKIKYNSNKKNLTIRNVNIQHDEMLTFLDRIAIWITNHVGTMGFFLFIFVWTFAWLGWNTLGPESLRFDPYPAFVFWLFLSNMLQIFLMPLIMVGQNLLAAHAELRAEADFAVNIRAELEIKSIVLELENQNKLIIKILEHIENKNVR